TSTRAHGGSGGSSRGSRAQASSGPAAGNGAAGRGGGATSSGRADAGPAASTSAASSGIARMRMTEGLGGEMSGYVQDSRLPGGSKQEKPAADKRRGRRSELN